MYHHLLGCLLAVLSAPAVLADGPAPVPDQVGVITGTFTPPPSVTGESAWLPITQIRQEKNLCVPTSAAMVLTYYGSPLPPRELKTWSRNEEYDPTAPFTDFTITFFADLLTGMAKHGIEWTNHGFSDTAAGFAKGLPAILAQLDQGHPVLIDTSLFTGHTFVIAGYRNAGATVIVVDPFIAPPGLREIPQAALQSIWNSKKSGADVRGAIFTAPPAH